MFWQWQNNSEADHVEIEMGLTGRISLLQGMSIAHTQSQVSMLGCECSLCSIASMYLWLPPDSKMCYSIQAVCKPSNKPLSFHFTVPYKFVKSVFPNGPQSPFYRPRELPRQPDAALLCYSFFGFSSAMHAISDEPFYKKWDCGTPPHLHLEIPPVNGLVYWQCLCRAAACTDFFFFPSNPSHLLSVWLFCPLLTVCCIQIQD